MDNFMKLEGLVHSFSKLSEEWEKIENVYSDKIAEKCPFDKNFREVLHDLQTWKNHLHDKK